MGDPASIGPELSLKAFAKPALFAKCKPVIIGDAAILAHCLAQHPELPLTLHPVNKISDCLFQAGTMDVYDLQLVTPAEIKLGAIAANSGDAAFHYVEKVIELALAHEIDATVTNAISKEAINLAGHHYAGHTEIYADLTQTKKYTMMLAHENLRVVHVSTHVSLRQACDLVKKERVLEVIEIANQACLALGIATPKIAVAGLNPHSGEHGMFGTEEIDEIIPAITAAQAENIHVDGPVPPDTVFSKARGGWYDIVVAMYHDQGHIPLKVVGFVYDQAQQKWQAVAGVNITLGLPIIRTSVDHGTAFDQAGLWRASELSLENAIEYALKLAQHHKE